VSTALDALARIKTSRRQALAGYLLLLPATVAVAALLVFPLVYSAWMSLTNAALLSSKFTFVGAKNYLELIDSSEFLAALWHDMIYTIGTTILSVGLGLGVALAFNRSFPGRSFLSGLVIAPYLIPSVATFLIFKWQLSTQFGTVNYVLQSMGLIEQAVSWLGNPRLAMFSVTLVTTWTFFPFAYMAILARLQSIPSNLYDAAAVDGATSFQRFRYVTLPQLRNVLFIVILLRGIWVFNNFDIIWLLTGGGPSQVTEHLPILVYLQVFQANNVSRGAAMAVVMFLFLVACSVMYFFAVPMRSKKS
jgi:multiple sugar transport system permease protein